MKIVFTELLLLGGMKQALRNVRRSGAGVAVCFRKSFLSCGSSLFSNTKTVTVSSALKFSTAVSSADLTDSSWSIVIAQFLSMLRSVVKTSHGIAST